MNSPQRERRLGVTTISVIPAPLITNSGNKAVIAVPIKLTHFHGTRDFASDAPQWRH